MIRLRTRDGGFHHANIEAMIFVAILMILAAVAFPQYMKVRDRRAATCLRNLLSLTDGKPPEKPVCPVGEKAYAPEPERVACPSPEKHLDTTPALVRSKQGPWQVRQTRPSSAGKTLEFRDSRLEVTESPGRAAVLVKPGAFVRFFFAPLMFLILLVVTLACLAKFFWMLWTRKWFDAIGPLFGMAVAGGLAFLSLTSFATSREWVLERSGARVTRVDYFFGRRTSEQPTTGCLGVVPTVAMDGHRLQLLHPPDEKGRRTTELGLVAKDRLDVAEWFHQRIAGP
ncbi:MAG: hypothetical protein EHM91_02870 [Planctomycetota bacterium]|nr:MAG: hypothetical protein EHM91_02870 [Planctomycetota bacterium]